MPRMKKVLFILGELNDTDIEWFIKKGKRQKVVPNTILIHEGQPIEAFYIVLGGMFSVTVSSLNNKEVAQIGAGEVLGEMSYIDSRPPSATVTALEESLLLSLAREDLTARLEEDNAFAARFYRALAIFLSYRLRYTHFGYGDSKTLKEDVEYEDELDMNILDNVSMAGLRYETILKRLRGGG